MDTATDRDPGKPFRTIQSIADAAKVDRHLASTWTKEADFPKKGRIGWSSPAVWKWIDAYNEKRSQRAKGAGDRAEKTRLECDKLRIVIQTEGERLAQAKAETARITSQIWEKKVVLAAWSDRNARIKGVIQSWRQHEVAKDRTAEGKVRVDGLADRLLARLSEEFSV